MEKHCYEIDKSRLYVSGYRAQDFQACKQKVKKEQKDKQKENEGETYAPGEL